jgi:hypothetical protein
MFIVQFFHNVKFCTDALPPFGVHLGVVCLYKRPFSTFNGEEFLVCAALSFDDSGLHTSTKDFKQPILALVPS